MGGQHTPYLPYLLLAQGGEAVTLQHLPQEAVGQLQSLVLPALAQLRQVLHQEAHHGLLQGREVEQVGHSVQLQVVGAVELLQSGETSAHASVLTAFFPVLSLQKHFACLLSKQASADSIQ